MKLPTRLAAALLCCSAVAGPRGAAAQGVGTPSPSGLEGLAFAGVLLGGGLVIGGFVTDGMILDDVTEGRGIRRGPAVAGTVLWSITSAIVVPSSIAIMDMLSHDGGLVAANVLVDAVVLGSLGLSIWGLTQPGYAPPGPAQPAAAPPWTRAWRVHPTMVSGARGTVLGAGLTLVM